MTGIEKVVGFHRPYSESKDKKGNTIYKSDPRMDQYTAQYYHNVGWNNSAGIKWSLTGIPGPNHMNWLTPELTGKYGITYTFVKAPVVATFPDKILGNWCAANDFEKTLAFNRINKPEDCKTGILTFATNDRGNGTVTTDAGICTPNDIHQLSDIRWRVHDFCDGGDDKSDTAFTFSDNRVYLSGFNNHKPKATTTVAQRVTAEELPDDDLVPDHTTPRERTNKPRHEHETREVHKPRHEHEHVTELHHHEPRSHVASRPRYRGNPGGGAIVRALIGVALRHFF
jgi:hypothetical protein